MPSFSKLFKSRDSSSHKPANPLVNGYTKPTKPPWSDAWIRTRVDPEEVVGLLSGCTRELKSRALDMPFLLLPFRPTSDPSAARTFVRNYFFPPGDREILRDEELMRELRLTEPMVLASVLKWCWSRLPGGVVTWEAYELFKVGEKDSQFARDAFATFVPISVESDARKQIVFDFFDLMAAIAAHGKSNGLGGRKLSRYAGWWAFEHYDTGKGFDAGYKDWSSAADAASHLFFAYLRSLSPDPARGTKGIIGLPISLQQLVQATEYPPEAPTLMRNHATKVVMIVDVVSPTPYALLRRAKNFEYRDDDSALQQFANYDDPVQALTEECRRVLKCISSTNQSNVSTSKASTSLKDASWSRFEDIGFGAIDESDNEDGADGSVLGPIRHSQGGLRTQARSPNGDLGRPTTPSWADFLSSGFIDEHAPKSPSSTLMPPEKFLPPIQTTPRGQSSQSHRRKLDDESNLEPGELASIGRLDLDDSFWWVWISSLSGEEPTSRKAVFGRCALIETVLRGGRWMIVEEQVKGAAPEPADGVYLAEKKGFLGFTTRRGRITRRKSAFKKNAPPNDLYGKAANFGPSSRTNIAPDQHARIQAAAVELHRRHQEQDHLAANKGARRGRHEDVSTKTNSVMTLQPAVMTEASPAMKWASQYDKNEIRAKYLGNDFAGKGSPSDLPAPPAANGVSSHDPTPSLPPYTREREPQVVSPPEHSPLPKSPIPPSKKESSPSRFPVSQPRQESPLPKTPSPPPPNEHPSAQLPSPPPSEEVAQTKPPGAAKHATNLPSSAHQTVTALPQPPSPIVTPTHASQASPGIPRKAVNQPRETGKLTKRRTGGAGIKGIFGNRRPREPSAIPSTSPTESSPAIAAARAAIASKNNPPANGQSVHHATTQIKRAPPSPDYSRTQRPLTPPSEPIYQPPVIPRVPNGVPHMAASQHPDGLPRMRHDSEGENLSRVDTNEREQADREFSTFDQGPLLEQPAFITPGSPRRPEPITPLEEEGPHQQAPGAFTNDADRERSDEVPELGREILHVQDRWAQIRKNAAERAARQNEEQNRPSDSKTDDGETSGEETIESRVARIKARVAELTGNIEAGKR